MNVYADVHLYDGEQAKKLDKILARLSTIKEILMATAAEYQAGFDRVDAATSNIATLIRTLIDRPLGGMSSAEEDAFKAKLESVAGSLEAMAATPTNPVPIEPPTDVPTP